MSSSNDGKLRCLPLVPPFHVVLVEPEIPPNTGNIARLCGATSSPLHLVGQLGFRIDERSVRRAGLDYWHLVSVTQHPDLATFRFRHPDARLRLFSANATRSYLEAGFRPGDALVFGRETSGLPERLLDEHADSVFGIPTSGGVRSLNLGNAVSIVLYEALRQADALRPIAR